MMRKFKVGDRAYLPVVDAEPDSDGEITVAGGRCRDDAWNFITPAKLVRTLPDPLTELERRVVETAVAWRQTDPAVASAYRAARDTHHAAVDALRVARAPKDPVHELADSLQELMVAVTESQHAQAFARANAAAAALAAVIEQQESE